MVSSGQKAKEKISPYRYGQKTGPAQPPKPWPQRFQPAPQEAPAPAVPVLGVAESVAVKSGVIEIVEAVEIAGYELIVRHLIVHKLIVREPILGRTDCARPGRARTDRAWRRCRGRLTIVRHCRRA